MNREKYFETSKSRDVDLRRASNGPRKTFEVQKMWQTHHEIVRLHILGLKNSSIARHLGISKATVGYTLNSPIVQDKIAVMHGARDAETLDLSAEILEIGQDAVRIHREILESPDVPKSVKQKSADSILDRIPETSKHRRVDARHLHGHFTAQEIEEIKERGRLAALESGELVVDVDAEVLPE